tara:strand:+ start:361 stop:1023 length:663 start_codon:yes stop_codon:yes gene_type:complete
MSNKNLLEEATVKKFMKLANIGKPLRESFVETLDENTPVSLDEKESKSKWGKGKDEYKREKNKKGVAKKAGVKGGHDKDYEGKRKKRKAQQEESLDEEMDAMDLFEEEDGLYEAEEEETEDIEIEDTEEEEIDVDVEVEEKDELEVDISEEDARALLRVADALAAALGVGREEEEEEIDIEEPEEEIDIEEPEEEETEEIMHEAMVRKIAARVAKRLLKK